MVLTRNTASAFNKERDDNSCWLVCVFHVLMDNIIPKKHLSRLSIKRYNPTMRTLIADTINKVGEEITVEGWVDTKRDHGKLTFIDMRDRSGKVQCVGFQKMGELTTESVIQIRGTIKERPERMINQNIVTGKIEIEVNDYTILNKALELPIQIDTEGKEINEESRLRYRYIDLRRERMQKIIRLRSRLFHAMREKLIENEFVDIETPILAKSTMEGARDFLVPSRFQPGKFYALPQSPQQYKQLLMTAGFEKYFQFARCFRDEDLRADRGFEFTQLDLEMSFVKREDVMATIEEVVKYSVKEVGGKLKSETFPVIDYKDAMTKYGADKFDLRTEEEKEQNVLAFAWVVNFPFFKKVDKKDAAEVRDGKSGWTFTHNPFSMPIAEHEDWLLKGEHIDEITTTQYDLVCNGLEVGGGSIRAHRQELLEATYRIMGYTAEQTQASVGHMIEAFGFGTPPHGGIALGVDRLVAILTGESSIKETIAFPTTSTGRTAVMEAPSEVSKVQLQELGLNVVEK